VRLLLVSEVHGGITHLGGASLIFELSDHAARLVGKLIKIFDGFQLFHDYPNLTFVSLL
jgi:hypothetical protein